MKFFRAFILCVTVSILPLAIAHSQENKDIKTIAGKVESIDREGGVISVKTDEGEMVFYIAAESQLLRDAHHISALEIAKNDLVTIYYSTSMGRNDIINLVANQPGLDK
jgi:hypothetical protein